MLILFVLTSSLGSLFCLRPVSLACSPTERRPGIGKRVKNMEPRVSDYKETSSQKSSTIPERTTRARSSTNDHLLPSPGDVSSSEAPLTRSLFLLLPSPGHRLLLSPSPRFLFPPMHLDLYIFSIHISGEPPRVSSLVLIS